MHHRKGQFYLFTAVILIGLAAALAITVQKPKVMDRSFELLSDNFLQEAPQVVASARYDDADVLIRFRNFSDMYLDYARSVDSQFGMVTTLQVDGRMLVVNYLGDAAQVTLEGTDVIESRNGTLA